MILFLFLTTFREHLGALAESGNGPSANSKLEPSVVCFGSASPASTLPVTFAKPLDRCLPQSVLDIADRLADQAVHVRMVLQPINGQRHNEALCVGENVILNPLDCRFEQRAGSVVKNRVPNFVPEPLHRPTSRAGRTSLWSACGIIGSAPSASVLAMDSEFQGIDYPNKLAGVRLGGLAVPLRLQSGKLKLAALAIPDARSSAIRKF